MLTLFCLRHSTIFPNIWRHNCAMSAADHLPEPEPDPAPTATAPRRANSRFMFSHPAHIIALGLGSGLSPFAPGTAGTLWAWLAYLVISPWFTPAQFGWFLLVCLVVGWWACTVCARNMRVADPGSIVWDEIVAFWIILWLLMPTGFVGQLVAFGLFRYFDAAKPGPVAWADKAFKGVGARGGFGIMFDDLVAAFCALLVIALWKFWF